MEKKRLEIVSFFIFCAGMLILAFFVFQPFFNILVLSTILALLFMPLYNRVLSLFKGGKSFFALLIVFFAFIFLIVPVLFFGLQILGQIQNLFTPIQNGEVQYVHSVQNSIETLVRHLFPSFSFDLSYYAGTVLTFVSNNFGAFLSQTAYIFFQTIFLLFAFFFFLRDGENIFSSLILLSPFEKEQTKEILNSVHTTITSVIRGTLFVGLIRLVLLTMVFYLFGVPNAMLWGSIAGIIGAIPGLGTPVVTVPIVIYLILNGNIAGAIGVGVLGIIIAFFIDSMLTAYFFGKGLDVSPIFMLFSIIGGVIFFGDLTIKVEEVLHCKSG